MGSYSYHSSQEVLDNSKTWINPPGLQRHQKKNLVFEGREELKDSRDERTIVRISHEDLYKAMANFFEIIIKTCKAKAEPNVAFHFTRYWAKRVNEDYNRIDRENLRKL
jgi:hypothetical protein